jgi:hypothetical protein
MKYVRIISASLFLVSILLFGFTLFGDGPIAHAAVSLLLWGSLGTFCFTEGFLFKPPKRTKLNIYGARFFFVAACLIVAQIVFALLTGRVQ